MLKRNQRAALYTTDGCKYRIDGQMDDLLLHHHNRDGLLLPFFFPHSFLTFLPSMLNRLVNLNMFTIIDLQEKK
jgi:hypothetical protein